MMMLCEMAPYIMLGLLIAGLLYAFVPARTMSRHLAKPGLGAVLKATAVGIPLPLCSCGVLPTAVALRRSGASKASTTAFLISTPQTGVDSIAATWSLLGPAFAVIRPIAALVTAVFGGVAVGRVENGEVSDCAALHDGCCEAEPETESEKTFMAKLIDAFRYGFYDMIQSIGTWLVVGLVVAALITVLVPADFFAAFADRPLLAMLVVVAVAVPMYVCATGSIPIALSLMLKGLSPGTAFVLLLAGPAANLASITILSRAMGRRSAAVYLISIVIGAIAFGLAIDYLLPRSWFPLPVGDSAACCHDNQSVIQLVCGGLFAALLIVAAIGRIITNYRQKHKTYKTMTKTYQIKGMNCPHCQKSVQQAIASVAGVKSVVVDLGSGIATVEGAPDDSAVRSAVEAAGFDVEQ